MGDPTFEPSEGRPRYGFRAFWCEEKTDIAEGHWSDHKMPKSGPNTVLLRSKPLRFGVGFRWCIVSLMSGGVAHKILLACHREKRNFCAYLFKSIGNDNLLLARLENHGTHPGIHIHACCQKTGPGAVGRTGYPEIARYPGPKSYHRSDEFPSSDDDALNLVGLHFNIPALRRTKPQLELGL